MILKTDIRYCSFFTPYSEGRDNMSRGIFTSLYIFREVLT